MTKIVDFKNSFYLRYLHCIGIGQCQGSRNQLKYRMQYRMSCQLIHGLELQDRCVTSVVLENRRNISWDSWPCVECTYSISD